jgi:SAM-dependent methyltransferase
VRDDGRVSDYRTVNLANWNSRVVHHEQSYGLDRFRADPTHLSDVVRFDLPRLGNIEGLDAVHLQCHIGTDTLSLARLGTRSVTGLDFSHPALAVAARLAADCSASITYVESELYDAPDALGGGRYDLVYTGIGALPWLPDIRRWANVVAELLRPGGRLFIRDGHPMLCTLAGGRPDGLVVVGYPYFETEGVPFSKPFSYWAHQEPLASPDTVQFNHGLAEVITAVMDAGMSLTSIEEHDSVPWNPLGDAMEAVSGGEFRLRHAPERLAASYTLQATKD